VCPWIGRTEAVKSDSASCMRLLHPAGNDDLACQTASYRCWGPRPRPNWSAVWPTGK